MNAENYPVKNFFEFLSTFRGKEIFTSSVEVLVWIMFLGKEGWIPTE
jgi:hypothetical protein